MISRSVIGGETIELGTQIALNGGGQTGLAASTRVTVQRKSDSKYYKWATSAFDSSTFAAADHEIVLAERTTGSAQGEAGYYYKALVTVAGRETLRVNYLETTLGLDEVELIEIDLLAGAAMLLAGRTWQNNNRV